MCLCTVSLHDSPGWLPATAAFKKKSCLKYNLFKWEEEVTAVLAAEFGCFSWKVVQGSKSNILPEVQNKSSEIVWVFL